MTSKARRYLELCKPKVVMLLVFTAIVGMFLAVPGMVPLDILLFATAGIGLSAASAAAINHVLDARIDAVMRRTKSEVAPELPEKIEQEIIDLRHELPFKICEDPIRRIRAEEREQPDPGRGEEGNAQEGGQRDKPSAAHISAFKFVNGGFGHLRTT